MNSEFRPRCPSCDMGVDTEQNPQFLPFCSERCRLIDLGRWLNEEHTLPCTDLDEESEGEPTSSVNSERKPNLPPGWHDA